MRLLSFLIGLSMATNVIADQGSITLNINKIEEPEGKLVIAVFDKPDHWLDSKSKEKPFRAFAVGVETNDPIEVVIDDLPEGSYAISVFQDLNRNEELDTNFIGFPKEPFGFSVPMGKFGPPSFDEASISVEGDVHILSIELN